MWPPEGRWWRQGPPSLIVWPCRLDVSAYAAKGREVVPPRVICPRCGGPTAPWSGYLRHLRDAELAVEGVEVPLTGWRADLVLRFDDVHVVVEVKLSSEASRPIERVVEAATLQVLSALPTDGTWRAAVVVFARNPPSETYRVARSVQKGRVSVVVIHAPAQVAADS